MVDGFLAIGRLIVGFFFASLLDSLRRRDVDKVEKVKALREAAKRVNLGPDNLPSICFYTLVNSPET